MRTASVYLRHGVPVILAAVLPFIISSCSDDGPGTQPTAGAPGTAGKVGAGGVAGSGVGGSAAGTPAVAGQAGTSGVAGAGTAGTGGTSGGMGGATGGSSGKGGSSAGTGGAAAGGGGVSVAGAGGATGGASGGTGGGGGSTGTFKLSSPDHAEGAMFAAKYTCAEKGFNGSIMPDLQWTAGPAGTKSYAITFIDVTLTEKNPPDQNGYHWTIYNIPPTTTSLPEGLTDAGTVGAKQTGPFLGPCPNFGGGSAKTDTYEFTIYALSSESLTLTGGSVTAQTRDADMKLEAMNLAKAKLTGTSSASPPN